MAPSHLSLCGTAELTRVCCVCCVCCACCVCCVWGQLRGGAGGEEASHGSGGDVPRGAGPLLCEGRDL